MSDKGLFHECPWCNYRCNCDDQPCSCCNEEDDMSDKTDMPDNLPYVYIDKSIWTKDYYMAHPFRGSAKDTKYISEQKHKESLQKEYIEGLDHATARISKEVTETIKDQ